jgi:hypothetical protein
LETFYENKWYVSFRAIRALGYKTDLPRVTDDFVAPNEGNLPEAVVGEVHDDETSDVEIIMSDKED